MKQVGYFFRLLSTLFSFCIFGLGSLFITLIIFPMIILFSRKDKTQRIRWVVKVSFKGFLCLIKSLGLLTIDIDDELRNVDIYGNIIIANHPTLIDVVILISIYPESTCIVKKALWDNRFIKGVVSAAKYIPNDHIDILLEKCKHALDNGSNLIIFPEGTRSTQGDELTFRRGAAHIALYSNANVQVIDINCYPITLAKGVPWYRLPQSKPLIKVSHRGEILAKEEYDLERPRSIVARELTKQLEGYYLVNNT